MEVVFSPRVRLAIYIITILGTPIVMYLRAHGWIGDLEVALWGAEVTAVTTMAALNVNKTVR